MNKKKGPAIFFFMVIILLIVPAFSGIAYAAERELPLFVDTVGVLTEKEAEALTKRLEEVSQDHDFDVVVVVLPELEGYGAHLYAADFFESNGFGQGDKLDGAILLLATEERDFGFASLGYGLEVFTPTGQKYLDQLFLPHLKEDQYFEAFMSFADGVDDFLVQAEAGSPYDTGNIPVSAKEVNKRRSAALFISLVLAFFIALFVTMGWKGQLKSVRSQDRAANYIRKGSLVLAKQKDIFLYQHVIRTERVKEEKTSGGGGSSFKTSSGRSATGHSGKY